MPEQTTIFPDLKNASVLITGGGSGIGAALTEGFARQGSRVAFIDIAVEASVALVDRLTGEVDHPPLFIEADLSDLHQVRNACARADEAHGAVTVLVNNAALDDRHEFLEMSGDYWDENQAVNVRPVAFTAQAVAPGMIAAGSGAIVNFTSTSYMLNIGSMPAYTAAKAGIVGLTKGLAGRLGPHGIRVNAIAPGWVMTERQKRLWVTEESLAAMIDRQCIKRPIEPEDMVGPCLFLASTASAMISAQVLIADGGMM
ncbi:3-oxoacyl-ACP reductase [Hoeflea sp. BAL378]|uniref:SDR family NAD(P)-dependent oxidoreductase n=1 Tax=Hoeflea sp. BAL378 TaxID=1547437 RepID=UPI0005133CC5|nr:SDR family oxidoreductase [Hoeflea sp. BAL378]KGF68246.1 3-oxoacyl-ACP reductase [Hoeflea sp. BAL378]